MTKIKEHFIELSCGKSRYLEAGSGPPLLLLHGMGVASSANTLDLLSPYLSEKFHVIAPDLLGFGLGTRAVEAGPSFELIVDQVREFLDYLGLETVHLVGHSLGGWIGTLLAYQSPQRIERLVMMCAAGLNRQIATGVTAKLKPDREQLEKLVRQWPSEAGRLSDADVQQLVTALFNAAAAPGAATSLNPLIEQMQNPIVRERYMLQRRLPYVAAPTLMIWGESDPIDPYPTWTSEYAELNGDMRRSTKPWVPPEVQFAPLPTGHYPHVELPQATAALIQNFLLE